MKYIIKDWAGNVLQYTGRFNFSAYGAYTGAPMEFESFEEAWEYIMGELTDRLNLDERDYGEYSVEENTGVRETRYLDPADPRSGIRVKGE